ncbi:MAG: type II toxin-antitoxin system VapC family toxin [Candidatus Microthrix sp.]|nr:type II toxin-antitoxin system VapC family toxin [Candidatus Microthrix sp.]
MSEDPANAEAPAAGLFDTSIFIAEETGRRIDRTHVPPASLISIITIGELRSGVLSASDVTTRANRLETLTTALALDPLPIDLAVASKWARLRSLLANEGLRMGINDSWIAATAMAHDMPVVTQDTGFPDLEELAVIRV